MSNQAAKSDSNKKPDKKGIRKQIVRGLQACIVEKGYAYTKLNDIAAKSELVPSHVRYYFTSKEEMLEYRFEEMCRDVAYRLAGFDRSSPSAWFRDFGYFMFNDNPQWKPTILVLMEVNVAVAHSDAMRRMKAESDRRVLKEFEEQLGSTQLAAGLDPAAAAQLTFAMMNGLLTNEAFESGPSVLEARQLFYAFVESMAGIKVSTESP
ncbi:MAG: TetR/AcrR family transcriptional regulator [Pseudomonadota bacterium]